MEELKNGIIRMLREEWNNRKECLPNHALVNLDKEYVYFKPIEKKVRQIIFKKLNK